MDRNQKIVIALIVFFLAAFGLHNFNSARSLGDRLNSAESKVSALEGSSVTHVTREQVKKVLDEELAADGQIGKVLTALKGEVATERDAALEPIKAQVDELDTVVNSTTADGLKSALAKIEETTKRHNAALYGKERGIIAAVTALAERHNAEHATASVNSSDAAAVRAAEAGAELDANSRETLSPFERMLAAVKGLSAEQYQVQKQKKLVVATNDNVPVPPIVRITVRGDQVKVEKIDPPKLRHVAPPSQ